MAWRSTVARTVRDQNLETRSARGRLKPSPKPYYRTIDPGLHLGYRKGKSGGRWVVRWYVGDRDYKTETIANADDVADADGDLQVGLRAAHVGLHPAGVQRDRGHASLA